MHYSKNFLLIVGIGFIVGELVLALEAYLIRDWITLQLVAYLPMLILMGLYFILPESTRWLIAKGIVMQDKKNGFMSNAFRYSNNIETTKKVFL